jgi:hypothetical protein
MVDSTATGAGTGFAEQQARSVLIIVARTRQLFGSDCDADVAEFRTDPALENDLGHGHF